MEISATCLYGGWGAHKERYKYDNIKNNKIKSYDMHHTLIGFLVQTLASSQSPLTRRF